MVKQRIPVLQFPSQPHSKVQSVTKDRHRSKTSDEEEALLGAILRSIDAEEAIRECAFPLDYASKGGSREVSGSLAFGLALSLNLSADKINGDREQL